MKNAFLILGMLLPLFSFSQFNKVTTIDNRVYEGVILSAMGKNIKFYTGVTPSLKGNKLEIIYVKEIYGDLANSIKKQLLRKTVMLFIIRYMMT